MKKLGFALLLAILLALLATPAFADDPDGAGTVLRLECNDQPGLLSRVAAAIYSQDVQVHNARIATFGERVEDTFLVSDADHQPLTPAAMEALAEAVRDHLEQG